MFQKISLPRAKLVINIIITVYKTFSAAQSQRQMDAYYDSQIKTNNRGKTQQNEAFCGPARQMGAGAGGLGAFAMRMGRVAIPIVRKYILPVAKQFGKNSLEAAIPKVGQVLGGRKRPSGRMLKHVAEIAAEKSLRTSGTRLTAGRAATPGARAARGRAGVAEPLLTGTTIRNGRKSVTPAALSSSSSLLSKTPKTIYKRNPAKRSRSDILSEIQFS